uniref:Uncharacterized protein n=1 Tax=Ascaris lumbricoides TaxID=6252 RepID=A0A0M3IJ98_ASCLU
MLYIFGFYVYVTSFFIRNEEKERKRRRHERKARYRQPEAVVVGSDSRKPSKESLEKRSSGDSGSDRNKSTVEQYANESINHQMSENSEKISRKVPTNKAAKKGDQIYRPSNERQTVKNSRVSQVRKEDESQSDSSDTDDTTPKKLKKKEVANYLIEDGDQIYRPSNERQTVKNSRVSQVRKEDESQSDSSDTDDTTPKKLKKKEVANYLIEDIASGTLSFRYRAPFDQQLIPFGIKLQAESSTSYKPYANEVGVNIEE